MRNLLGKIKCSTCPYRKQCHMELNDIARLEEVVKELTYELNEYEKEVQQLQKERNRLYEEVHELKQKNRRVAGKDKRDEVIDVLDVMVKMGKL